MLNSSRKLSGKNFFFRLRGKAPYMILPVFLLTVLSILAFRQPAPLSLPNGVLSDPLQLPAGWPALPTPVDNPITAEKFELGRYLFYETGLSGDNKTSCASCHNPRLSFAARGAHAGAFSDTGKPARVVPRLMNLAYDTVFTWDGHLHSLEEQVHVAVLKKGDLQADTNIAFAKLAKNPAYTALFTAAFGDGTITLDRIAKAVATFERCLISANSPYDQYLQTGDTSAFQGGAIRGMKLFFDTTSTNCSFCHNSLGNGNPNSSGQTFSDNAYYRTGTFELIDPQTGRSGYGLDTTHDTTIHLDPGLAGVTKNPNDIGKFRTPSLRNVSLTPPFGAAGSVTTIAQLLANYNHGGDTTKQVKNQSSRIKPLHLTVSQVNDLAAFLNSLTDLSYISNPAFEDPGTPTMQVDGHIIAGDLSLYPNPANGVVNVECEALDGPTDATLISERGEAVWHKAVTADGKLRLDFSAIPSGSYRLDLRTGNVRRATKIVIQR